MSNEKNMSLLGHLHELRGRLLRSLIIVGILIVVAFYFYEELLEVLRYPAPADITLQAVKLTEMFSTSMRVSIIAGVVMAIPYLTWEFLMFISPALTRREKKLLYIIFPWIILMFCAGVAFAFFILIPTITGFLLNFGNSIVEVQPMFSDYVNIVTRLLLVSGLIFEFPVLTTFLARLGIVNPKWLASKRKPAIIIALVLAAVITPTPDPVNQCIVAGVLVVLYEMSIWFSRLVYKKKPDTSEQEPVLS